MTLVLCAVADDAVIMVADRKVTWSKNTIVAAERNKLVMYRNHFVFGFSGLAMFAEQRMDEWLGRLLREHADFEAALDDVARRATAYFATLPAWVPRRQAFVGVGWASNAQDSLFPVWVCVSNAWDHPKRRWLPNVRPTFEVAVERLPPSLRWGLCPSIGAQLLAEEKAQLRALVRPALKRRTHGAAAARLMGRMVRTIAAREKSVGEDSTCVILPKPKANKQCNFIIPPVQFASKGVGGEPIPLAFEINPHDTTYRWSPPILVAAGIMLIPEVTLGLEGRLESFRARALKSVNAQPDLVSFGIGVTDGTKEAMLVIGTDGSQKIVEQVRQTGADVFDDGSNKDH